MRILFIGDIVGKPGRKILSNNLPMLKKLHNIDFVVANGENSAGGNGITKNMAEELSRCGIDAITLGDHIWDQRCLISEIESIENICRPANLPPGNPGRDFVIVERDGKKLGVFCLLGQTLMKIKADCPFRAAAEMSAKLSEMCDAVLLDFHAETSSEKVSMGWYLDGKVSCVLGTHTHIPTNDARIMPNGTAYLTDAGMTGPWNSCLGRDKNAIIEKFLDGRPRQFTMAEGDDRICGCIIDFDDSVRRAKSIVPLIYPPFKNADILSDGFRAESPQNIGNPASSEDSDAPSQDSQGALF